MLTLSRKRLSDPLRFSDITALLLTAKAFPSKKTYGGFETEEEDDAGFAQPCRNSESRRGGSKNFFGKERSRL